jgi:hypothetical protein
MEREYYAIAKVPTPDIADPYKYVPRNTELLFFTGGIQAIKYMQQQLEFPQEPSMSWDNPKNPTNDPKNPNKPIGLTQSYIVFKTPIGSPLQVDASTEQIPGCIGHAQRERHATVHAAMMGRDSVSDTIKYLLYYPRREFAVTPPEELQNRIDACVKEQNRLRREVTLNNTPMPDLFPDEPADDEKSGPELIKYFYDQLTERGLDGYAMQMYHTYFDEAFITMKSYDDDGRSAAHVVIRDIFNEIARADITEEISEWAAHVVKQVETQSHPADAWGDDDPGDPYGNRRLLPEDVEGLLGYRPDELSY